MNECLFCRIAKGREKSWIVYQDRFVIALLNPYPLTKGHTLIIPTHHYESIFDIPSPLLNRIMSLSKRLSEKYERTLKIQGVAIEVLNHNRKSKAFKHFHLHLIPRYDKSSKRDPANVKPGAKLPRVTDRTLNSILSLVKGLQNNG